MSHIATVTRNRRLVARMYMTGKQVQRIVTRRRGGWKYQDAYSIATYAPSTTQDGRYVWRSLGTRGKYSEPQLRALKLSSMRHGSLHCRTMRASDLG